jgi:predicted CXXCH cytochrome family protein
VDLLSRDPSQSELNEDPHETAAEAPRRSSLRSRTGRAQGRFPVRGLMIFGLVAFVIGQLAFFGSALTETGCDSCHVPAQASERHFQTAHAEAACLDCHSPGGLMSWPILSVRAAGNLWVALDPRDDPVPQAVVESRTCRSCHPEVVEGGVLTGTRLKMSHEEPLRAQLSCTACHLTETHARASVFQQRDHSFCAGCHDGVVADNSCLTCHTSEPPRDPSALPGQEAVVHGPRWEQTHAMGEKASCTTCHERSDCAQCHGIELPHSPTSWPNLHGREALAVGQETCTDCHQEAFCSGCHQTEMPHPEDYLPRHSAEARERGEDSCDACHIRDSCRTCHINHTHPGIPRERLERLMETAG